MAHNVEPMDIDNIEGDFDNKENTYHHSNVLPRTPCTEKGYEELDVSELNMKLRYSITPASSPMSKSYTAHCLDNRNSECTENFVNSIDNTNLTHSFNSTLTKTDSLSKSSKLQPLQLHTTDTSLDKNRNASVLRPLDTTVKEDCNNITVTVLEANDNDENLSLPSSSSSAVHTPEATTPTKEILKHDGGSPIMRGLKSVLNMFRASQSPIPLAESEDNVAKHDISSPVDVVSNTQSDTSQVALASTPIAARKQREPSSKRGSPLKESIVFNEDLEKELLWKDETTILFSEEKIPIHKLLFQQSKHVPPVSKEYEVPLMAPFADDSLNETVEFMDVSYNDSVIKNKTISEITDAPPNANVAESDSEFVDCETTFTQQSDDEHNTELEKENKTSAVNISENSINKTAQELQVTATEESHKKPLDFTVAEVTEDVYEQAEKNMQEPLNSTVTTESKDIKSQDATHENETGINNTNAIESLDGTIPTQSEDKPSTLTSTFMNITQDFETQMPSDVTPVLDATVAVNTDNTSSSSVMYNAIQSIEVTSSIDDTKPANTTVSIESFDKPMSVSSFIMNTTQFAVEQLNTTTAIDDKPVSASTFIMNATQNIESALADENINEQINVTKTIEDNPVSSSTFILNESQNIGNLPVPENENKGLNETKNLKDKPVSSSTFVMSKSQNIETHSKLENVNNQTNLTKEIDDIMNEAQNIEARSQTQVVNDHLNATVLIKSDEVVCTEIKNTTQNIQTELTKPLDATVIVSSVDIPVSSSPFTMDATQNAYSYLATGLNDEVEREVDTVIVDSKDMTASSTFIKDVIQDVLPPVIVSGENITTPLESTILVDSQNKSISSSTFVKYIRQNVDKESTDAITTEPISSFTITKDILDIENQAGVNDNIQNLNSTHVVEQSQQVIIPSITKGDIKDSEMCAISESLDVTLSVDKSMSSFVDFKDVTYQIVDPEVVNNCINALDITLNTEVTYPPTTAQVNTFVSEYPLTSDTSKLLDATVTMQTPEATSMLTQDNTKIEIINDTVANAKKDPISIELHLESLKPQDLVDKVNKQTVGDQVTPKEIVKIAEPVNPDLLNSSGDIAEVSINITEGQVIENKTVEIQGDKGCGDNEPANIPLPDEDDLEIDPLKDCVINNVANSSVLPDVINDLDSSKIQDANRIDEVPINTIHLAKEPADLITDTLSNKELEIDKSDINNDKASNGNNSKEKRNIENYEILTDASTTDNLLKNVVKGILPENPTELALPVEHIDEQTNTVVSEMLVINSEDQPESMDISYNTHDISVQKYSVITALDQNIVKANEEKQDISVPCEAKTDSVANITPFDINVLHNMSVDDMEIGMAPDVLAENTTTKSLDSMPYTESDMAAKKEDIHEEILVSENNSPYVLVSVDKDDSSLEEDFEKIENPLDSKSKISPSPPASPPIASKGYNFNFDEIVDPFATKTKIRVTPPLDSPWQMVKQEKQEVKKEVPKRELVNKNKRKSFPVRPKPVITKKNFNNTFEGSLPIDNGTIKEKFVSGDNILPSENQSVKEKSEFVSNHKTDAKDISKLNNTDYVTAEGSIVSQTNIEETELNGVEKSELENNTDNISKVVVSAETENEAIRPENKSPVSTTPSSSDQSVYLSAATSSGDSMTARNVFNLPEIDDMNFNPFATKSKVRLSPPPSLEVVEAVAVNLDEKVPENKQHNLSQNKSGHDENDVSNASNTTCSSKDDKNATIREVHTDSEDTIEGPFLEAEDNEVVGLNVENNIKDDDFTGLGLENDMMQFSDLPAQDNEDNELFIDAAAYEFLLNQNKSNVVVDSGKESLFLKFDPLFAKRLSSEGIAAALSKIQKRQSTPKKMAKPPQIANPEQVVPGPSTSKVSSQQLNTTEDITEELNVTTSKPMMVVTPAVNPIVTPRKPTTPTSSNRRSITFTSPAIAVIDRLLSMSANNSFVDQNNTIAQVSREQNEADMALVQLRELLAEKEISVYNLRSESKDLKDRLTTLESQMQALEAESEQRLKKVNELTEKLTEKTKINKSMAAVVEEYERTIASLIAETEQDRKRHAEERERLIKERDEQTAHLASMEVSFSDLHSKYEKSKQIILSCKANEDTYKKSIKDFEENLTKMQNNYELLKQHATSKLNHANQELEKMNRAHESEVLKLNAMIKRKELHITSLEETLAQKTKANEELTAICDELINKVG